MADVVNFTGITTLSLTAERVLQSAMDAALSEVIVIGVTEDGDEYFASSNADGGFVVWHMERAKHKLMLVVDDMMEGR